MYIRACTLYIASIANVTLSVFDRSIDHVFLNRISFFKKKLNIFFFIYKYERKKLNIVKNIFNPFFMVRPPYIDRSFKRKPFAYRQPVYESLVTKGLIIYFTFLPSNSCLYRLNYRNTLNCMHKCKHLT